jgi:Sec-independent protein translocase protein TatA
MFGFSLAELIVVLLVILIFIKPADLPEIAHFLGKIFYRAKRLYQDLKSSFKEMEKEFGVDELRHELNRGIAEEKSKLEDDFTVIVDMNGNEHRVPNVGKIRPDLNDEELKKEIEELNKNNAKNREPNSSV